jgi:flap endonuclease GEN
MSDIEAGLGLKRKHLIAISLLVGNDHNLSGVQGIGLDTAHRLVQAFNEDDILNRCASNCFDMSVCFIFIFIFCH